MMASQETLDQWRHEGFDAKINCSEGEPARGTFRGVHELFFDEPEYIDVGNDEYPCPHDYLLAAVGGCQAEILKQCLEKSRIDEYDIEIDVQSKKGRTDVDDEIPETADIRIAEMHTDVTVSVPERFSKRARRCVEVFEANCPISQSVAAGVELYTVADLEEASD